MIVYDEAVAVAVTAVEAVVWKAVVASLKAETDSEGILTDAEVVDSIETSALAFVMVAVLATPYFQAVLAVV